MKWGKGNRNLVQKNMFEAIFLNLLKYSNPTVSPPPLDLTSALPVDLTGDLRRIHRPLPFEHIFEFMHISYAFSVPVAFLLCIGSPKLTLIRVAYGYSSVQDKHVAVVVCVQQYSLTFSNMSNLIPLNAATS